MLGADVIIGYGFVEVKAKKLNGSRIYLDFPSVGATENIMMAAVFAEGDNNNRKCSWRTRNMGFSKIFK